MPNIVIFFKKSACVPPSIFGSKTFVSMASPYHNCILLLENFEGIGSRIHKNKEFTHLVGVPNTMIVVQIL